MITRWCLRVYNYMRHHYGTRLQVSRMLLNCFASSVHVFIAFPLTEEAAVISIYDIS